MVRFIIAYLAVMKVCILRVGSGGDRRRQQAEDWICSVCHKMNFARRKECFSCGHPMGPDSKLGLVFLIYRKSSSQPNLTYRYSVSELKKPSRSREIGK